MANQNKRHNPAITCNTDVLMAAIPPAVDEGIRKYSLEKKRNLKN